jgi:methyltransferase (TIGR00027 family)
LVNIGGMEVEISAIPAGVGWTALLTAYSRAQESREADRLFGDTLAMAFVAVAHGADIEGRANLPRLGPAKDDGSSTLWNAFRFYFTQRTPFYDGHITAAAVGGCEQVVILGAGLDSRAFRLGLAHDVTIFEVDRAPVHEFKSAVLDQNGAVPTCTRVPVVADIAQNMSESLLQSGFDISVPTVWVAEGLLMYLSHHEADQLFDEITKMSVPGSRFVGEYFGRSWENVDVRYETLEAEDRAVWDLLKREFRSGPAGLHPGEWLPEHGWAPQEITTISEVGKRTGRPVPEEFSQLGAPQIWLFSGALNTNTA